MTKSRSTIGLVLYAVLGAVLGGFFVWLAVRGQDWTEFAAALEEASVPLLLLGLALVFASGVIRAYRWRLLLVREQVSLRRLYVVEHAGLGANIVSPVRILAEPVQFGLLTLRDKLRGGDVLASLSLQRATDLFVTLGIFALGALLLPALAEFGPYAVLIGIVGGLLMLSPFIIIPLAARAGRLRRFGLVRTFLEVTSEMRHRKVRGAGVMAVATLYWVSVGAIGWVLSRALGIDLPFFVMVVLVLGIIFVSTSVPGLPAAIGTFEVATIFLLDQFGIGSERALSFAVVFHIALFLPPLLIAAVALPMEGVRSLGALRELVSHYRRAPERAGRRDEESESRAA